MTYRGYVYILANKLNTVLYVGVTSNLAKRVWEHKHDFVKGFTQKYQVHKLVYFDVAEEIREAIIREKQIKHWKRAWKIQLIEEKNKEWNDL